MGLSPKGPDAIRSFTSRPIGPSHSPTFLYTDLIMTTIGLDFDSS